MTSTILVVDDEPVNREVLATILGYAGHVVVEAGDGAEALALVRDRRPDLVISDILMPAMDGYEFVRQLRGDPGIAHTRVMFYTANYFEREARGLATACGVAHVLTKPCEPEMILRTVSGALDNAPVRRPLPDLADTFDREHLRVMTNKLSAKVCELEATQQRFAALVKVGQQLNQQPDVKSLLHHFERAGRELIAARHTTVRLTGDIAPEARDSDAEGPTLESRITSATRDYGTICFAGKIGGEPFTEEDGQVALGLASLFAVAYENALRLEALQRHNAELELRVSERTAELKRSNEELEQFAYVASHDLQEPLRMVASYTELLGRRYTGRLDDDADEFIGYAVDGARRMQELIRDLLTYSRLNRGSAPEAIPADVAIDEAISRLEFAIRDAGAVVTRDPLPTVVADRGQLVQLFQNLVGNAIKFRSTAAPAVHISAAQTDSEWVFTVRDNGIGIEPQYADRIFTIFQRLHSRAEYPGTGIGLAICKRIVSRLGGTIWVKSAPGGGSMFHFSVPRQASQES